MISLMGIDWLFGDPSIAESKSTIKLRQLKSRLSVKTDFLPLQQPLTLQVLRLGREANRAFRINVYCIVYRGNFKSVLIRS